MVLYFQMTHQNADEKWPDAGRMIGNEQRTVFMRVTP